MVGIIDVGGGLRDIYGAGVLDYCMDHNITFDYHVGISAGSANMVSFLAGQRGRNYMFYTEYCFRREYMSMNQLLKNGSYINLDYVYADLSNSDGEYPLDYEAMCAAGKPLIVVATDARTGRAKYFTMEDMKQDDYSIIKASSCVPVVNKPYIIDGVPYFDGGLSDPIPIRMAMEDGCDKVVVILTRPADYYRDPRKDRNPARLLFQTWPNAGRALLRRGAYYNRSLELCRQYAKEGKVLIVAPESIAGMKTLTKDLDALNLMYNEGLQDGEAILEFLR